MSQEASKFRDRWQREGLWNKYFVPGKKVIDVGCGDDPIVPDAIRWDMEQGDGQHLRGTENDSVDIAYSSHFLEHTRDPLEALLQQWRMIKLGGYLIFLVPDEDLYEQGVWPSIFNTDHKHTYTIGKDVTWSPAGKNIVDLVALLPRHKIVSMRIIDTGYDYKTDKIFDQTDTTKAECMIEVVIQKDPMQPDFQTALKKVFRCPRCKHVEFVVRGVDREGKLDSWCKHCGAIGTLELNE